MSAIHIDHLAVVVDDLDTALKFWHEALGLPLDRVEDIAAEAVQAAFLTVGGAHVELLQPTTDDSGIARYLQKRGAGMHHLCLGVADIDAALAHISAQGFELINETPRTRADGTRYAFVHPKSTGGVMVELYEKAK
jgi:methylmalonyl-CoA/ethylmalonyl-CoA epimerase